MTFMSNRETTVICQKCNIRHVNTNSQRCEDHKRKFYPRKCWQHKFSILNMQPDRMIKCSTPECLETRKG